MPSHIHQATAVRPPSVPQRQPGNIQGSSRRVRQLSATSDMMKNSARAMQLKLMQGMMRKPGSPIIQRKEATTLQQGKLNMIGETHTDYSDEKDRMYESKKIRETLVGAKYFTEGMLKTTPQTADYADPVHLRLEQAIAFVRKACDELLPQLKNFANEPLDEALKANTKMETSLAIIVGEIAPMIMKGDDNLDIVEHIKTQNYPDQILEKLSQSDNWNFGDQLDLEDPRYEAFLNLLDLIADEYDKRDVDVTVDQSDGKVSPLLTGQVLANSVRNLYATHKGRLPPNLTIYYQFKSDDLYAGKEHFKFFPGSVQPALEAWGEIESLDGKLKTLIEEKRYDLLSTQISEAHHCLSSLIRFLDEGMLVGQQARSVTDVCLARSKAMHQAATANKSEPIAWKVGNLHIMDIRALENAGKLTTEYAYIEKDIFKKTYLNDDEMRKHVKAHGDSDPSYHDERQQQKTLREKAAKRLTEDSPARHFNARLLDTAKRVNDIGGWTFAAMKRSGFYLTLWDAETNPRIDWDKKTTQVAMDNKLKLLETYLRVLHLIHRSGTAPELLLANSDQATRRKLELDPDFIRDRHRFNDLLSGEPAAFIKQAPDLGDSMKRAFNRVLLAEASSGNRRPQSGLCGGFFGMFG